MDKKKTIFDYAAQTLTVFGLTVMFIAMCSYVAGDKGSEISTLFALGADGVSVSALIQLMMLSILVTLARFLFFSDRVIKKLSAGARTMGMLISCIAVIVVFILVFDWFPDGEIWPWLCFGGSFILCFAVSYMVTVKKEQIENQKMAEALERLKNEGD